MEVWSRIQFLVITIAAAVMCAATAVIPACGIQGHYLVGICMKIEGIIQANERGQDSTTTTEGSKCEQVVPTITNDYVSKI